MSRRIHCQVLEMPVADHLENGNDRALPRDLLPWADPYIAALLNKLARANPATDLDWQQPTDDSNHTAYRDTDFHDAGSYDAELDEALIDEAADMYGRFFPDFEQNQDTGVAQPQAAFYPPVYGDWPLLADLP